MGKEIPNSDFNALWKSAADILLKYGFDFSLVNGWKDDDPFGPTIQGYYHLHSVWMDSANADIMLQC